VAESPVGPAAPPDAVKLTPREYQIAQRLEGGLTNKEIAAALGISVITVKNHVHNILGKLSLRRRGEAAAVVRMLHPAPAAREI
jgi:DNA-binding NarL/FixJ family response regulator